MTRLVPAAARRTAGRIAVPLGALALATTLWDEWYRPGSAVPAAERGDPEAGLSAWQAFHGLDVALLALAGLAVVLVVVEIAGRAEAAAPLITLAGGAAAAIVLARILVPPGPDGALDPQSAPGVAFFAALLIAVGGRLIWNAPGRALEELDQAPGWSVTGNPRSVPPPTASGRPAA